MLNSLKSFWTPYATTIVSYNNKFEFDEIGLHGYNQFNEQVLQSFWNYLPTS
jgi:hypothetical protein